MNRTKLVQGIVWLEQLSKRAVAEAAKLRAQLKDDARAEFEEQGTASTWRIPDIATVSTAVTHESVVVDNLAKLTDWVAARFPTEVVAQPTIRPAFLDQLLERLTQHAGDGVVCLVDTGEVIPGLTARAGGEFKGISISVTSVGREVFGALAEHSLRELVAKADQPVVLAELSPAPEGQP